MILTTAYGFSFLGYVFFSRYKQRRMATWSALSANTKACIKILGISSAVLFILALAEAFIPTVILTGFVLRMGSMHPMRKNRVEATPLSTQLLVFVTTAVGIKVVASVCINVVYYLSVALYALFLSSAFSPAIIFLKSVVILLLAVVSFKLWKAYRADAFRENSLLQLMFILPGVGLGLAIISVWLDINFSSVGLERSLRAHGVDKHLIYSQSTHRESIHRTVSQSATKLKNTVTSNDYTLLSVIEDYENSLSHRSDLSSEDRQSKLGQVQSAKSILPNMYLDYQDRTSSVTISALTSLLANAIMDEQHRVAGVGAVTCQERLVGALSEMVEDKGMICSAGQFNKLIESQSHTLQAVSIESVCVTTITDYIQLKLRALQAKLPSEQPNPVEAKQLLLEDACTHLAEGTSLSSESVSSIKQTIEQVVGGIDLGDYFSFPNGR